VDDLLKELSLLTPVQRSDYLSRPGYEVYIKRDDLIHPHISGNKYRKLKYNLLEALRLEAQVLITFGGAYSNHLVAVAAVGYLLKKRTVGLVRGYSLDEQNPTIQLLRSYNMELHLVKPNEYSVKEDSTVISSILSSYKDFYLIPEGGTNDLALQGVTEGILEIADLDSFDTVVLALGTGGTAAGVCVAIEKLKTTLIGVSPFKGDKGKYRGIELMSINQRQKLDIIPSSLQVRFGGYHSDLVRVMDEMEDQDGVKIDPIYLAKTVYTLQELMNQKALPQESKILLLHSGGMQSRAGYEYQYAQKMAKEKAMN